MWHRLYQGGSSLEGGTLQQLRNLINRRNIGVATNVSGHVNEVQDFLELVVHCHINACAMHHFSMNNIDDVPHTSTFPADIAAMSAKQKWQLYYARLCEIVDNYIIPKQFAVSTTSISQSSVAMGQGRHENPHICRVEQEHSYARVQITPQLRCLPSTIAQVAQRKKPSETVRQVSIDGVFNYASAVLNDGLLLLEFCDAIKEGDGKRILRCWKALLIYFYHARHFNYAKEAILLQAAVEAKATPHLGAQITWSRVVNTRGGPGNNIPVDLHNEHINRSLKDTLAGLGANINPDTIIQCGKSLKGLMDTVNNFDKEHSIHAVSTQHTRASVVKDENVILDELVKSKVFDYIPGREHRTFKGIVPNLAVSVNKEKLFSTINGYKRDLKCKANVAKLYKHNI